MFALLMLVFGISDGGKAFEVCAPEVQKQLSLEQLDLSTRDCELAIEGTDEHVVVIRRGQETLLRREVGKGTCEQASKAAVVIVKRWLTSIGQLDLETKRQDVVASQPNFPRKPSKPRKRGPRVVAAEKRLEVSRTPPLEPSLKAEDEKTAVTPVPVEHAQLETSKPVAPGAAVPPSLPSKSSERELKSTAVTPPIEAVQNKPSISDSSRANSTPPRVAEVKIAAIEASPRSSTAESDGLSSAPAAPPPSPPPLPASQTVEQISPPLRIEVTHLEALVGGGVVAPATSGIATPLVGIDLSLTLNRRVRIPLWGAFDFGGGLAVVDEKGFSRGSLSARGWYVVPGAMVCTDTALRACGGVTLGVKILQAEASGAFVFQNRSAVAAEFLVAPSVQFAWLLGRFEVAVDASLIATPVPSAFVIDGLPTRLATPQFQGLFRLSVGTGSI